MTRIIGGLARGRRLEVPRAGTRPTSDRVREAMFNTLASRVRLDGARVLDLFAGSGALGLEALSRGASSAVLVESNAKAVGVIRRNIDTVALPGAHVVQTPVNRFESDEPFDLVLADPPYAYDPAELAGLLLALSKSLLSANGTLVLETSAHVESPDISDLTWFAEKRYGDTVLWYGRRR